MKDPSIIRERSLVVQKKIGLLGTFIGLIVLALNCSKVVFFEGDYLSLLTKPNVIIVFFLTLLVYLSSRILTPPFRILQILILVTQSYLSIQDDPNSFYGIFPAALAIGLAYKYGFLEKFLKVKIIISAIVYVIAIQISAYKNNEEVALIGISAFFYIAFVLLFIWILFEQNFREVVKEKETLEEHVERYRPLVEFSENIMGLSHNLKNDLQVISSSIYFIERNQISYAKSIIQEGINRISNTINGITNIRQYIELDEKILINIHEFFHSIIEWNICNNDLKKRINFSVETDPTLSVFTNASSLQATIDNIIKNAYEAIATSSKGRGNITMQSIRNEDTITISIKNDGPPIPWCMECDRLISCMECNKFKIGNTTKTNGRGIGIVSIKEMIKKEGGTLEVYSDNSYTQFNINFKWGESL